MCVYMYVGVSQDMEIQGCLGNISMKKVCVLRTDADLVLCCVGVCVCLCVEGGM